MQLSIRLHWHKTGGSLRDTHRGTEVKVPSLLLWLSSVQTETETEGRSAHRGEDESWKTHLSDRWWWGSALPSYSRPIAPPKIPVWTHTYTRTHTQMNMKTASAQFLKRDTGNNTLSLSLHTWYLHTLSVWFLPVSDNVCVRVCVCVCAYSRNADELPLTAGCGHGGLFGLYAGSSLRPACSLPHCGCCSPGSCCSTRLSLTAVKHTHTHTHTHTWRCSRATAAWC